MSPAMSGRLPLLLFSSLQLLALAVIINSWGRSVKEEARSQAGWKQEVLDRGKDILWHVTSSCGYLSDRRLVVTSQRVVTPKGVVPAAVYVEDGKIAKVVPLSRVPQAPRFGTVIDYGSSVISPGIIDTHVQLNAPGREDWEGIESGTKSAAAGGVTTILDMPFNDNLPTTSMNDVRFKLMYFKDMSFVNYGVWGGLVADNAEAPDVLSGMLNNGALGLRVLLSSALGNSSRSLLQGAIPVVMNHGAPLYVHTELLSSIDTKGDPVVYETYLQTQPPKLEKDTIQFLIDVLTNYKDANFTKGFRVHIAQLADAESLSLIKRAHNAGLPISVETCPHYVKFRAEEIPKGATEFKTTPPIRSKNNAAGLWAALIDGSIDMVSSGHSPAEMSLEPQDSFLDARGGISGLQYTLPAVWSMNRNQNLSLQRMSEILSENPAKLSNLHKSKGAIKAGYDADLMVWDPDKLADTTSAGCYDKQKLTPYRGLSMNGRVLATWVHGRLIFKENQGVSRHPCGQMIGLGQWARKCWFFC